MLGSGSGGGKSVNSKMTELFASCIGGDTAKLMDLIDKGADINAIDPRSGLTLLTTAILTNRIDITSELISRGVDLSAAATIGTGPLSYAGITPLMMACRGGNMDITKILVAAGCRHDTLDSNENTIMHHACHSGKLELARYLVKKFGIQEFDRVNKKGVRPAAAAIQSGNRELVRYLLEEIQKQAQGEDRDGSKSAGAPATRAEKSTPPAALGAPLEDEEYDGMIPKKLMDIIESGKDAADEVIIASIAGVEESRIDEILIELSASEDTENGHLIDRISSVIVNRVRHLDQRLVNLLHASITCNHFLTTKAIIAKMARKPKLLFSRDEVDGTEECVLHLISQNKEDHWYAMLKDLVTKYPKFIESADYYGHTPLHAACEYGSIKGIEILIANKANVNAQNDNGETPIMLALKSKEFSEDQLLEMVTKMSDICDLSIRDSHKFSAACYAAERGFEKVKEIFLSEKNIRKTLTEELYPGITSYLESDPTLAKKLAICPGDAIETEIETYLESKKAAKADKKKAKRQAQRSATKFSRKGGPATAPSTLPEAATTPEKTPAKMPTELLEEMKSRHASLTESLRRKRLTALEIGSEAIEALRTKNVKLIKAALIESNDEYLLSTIYKQSPILQAVMEGDAAILEQAIYGTSSKEYEVTRLALGSRVYQPLMLQKIAAATDIDMKLQIADVSIFKGEDAALELGSRLSAAILQMTGAPYQLNPESVNVFTTHRGTTVNINLSFQYPGAPDIDITVHDHRYQSQSPTTINECAIVKTDDQESKVKAGIAILRPAINYEYILLSDADYASEKKLTSFVRAMITLSKAGKDPVKTIKQNKDNLEEFVLSSLDPSNSLLRLELLSTNLVRAGEKAREIKPDEPELVAKITQQAEKISAFYRDAIADLKTKVEETWKSRYDREVQKSATLEVVVARQDATIAERDAQIVELQRQLAATQAMMTQSSQVARYPTTHARGLGFHTLPTNMTPGRGRHPGARTEQPVGKVQTQLFPGSGLVMTPPDLTPGKPNPNSRESSPTRMPSTFKASAVNLTAEQARPLGK